MACKSENSEKPDRRDGVDNNRYPQAVHGGELDGDVDVLDPERGVLERDSNNLPDVVALGIHPDLTQEQALFLTLWNDVQHVLWNHSKVLLAQEDEFIIGSADVPLVTFLGRSYFVLQDGAYDFYTSRATLRIGDFECFGVGRNKADLGRDVRHGLWIVAPEYLIFPRHLGGAERGPGSAPRFAPKNPESSSALAGLLLPVRVTNKEKSKPLAPEKEER